MKNKMMRIASILMVAVLLTTCAISGTFAKYVTTASGADTARVAKWGVLIQAEGDGLFKTEYEPDDTSYTKSDYTVESSNKTSTVETEIKKVVAPGTKSDEEAPFTVTVSGNPEVATRVTVSIAKGFKDVVLPKGTYDDYTKPSTITVVDGEKTVTYEQFKLDEDYYPIVYTITQKSGDPSANGKVAAPITGTLKEIAAALADLKLEFAPNTDLSSQFEITWAWAFEQELTTEGATDEEKAAYVALYDAADTYLGNVAAGVVEDEGACTEINFNLAITVVQVD